MSTEVLNLPKRGGRLTKRTPENATRLCELLAKGVPVTHALAVLPMSFQCYSDWKAADDEFREQISRAVAEGVNRRLDIIERAAGSGDWRAAAWLLEHVHPESFAKSRVEHAHVHVGKVTHEFVVPVEVLNAIADARKKHEATERQ